MKKKTIDSIGTVDLNEVSMDLAGQITIHMTLEEIGEEADKIIDNCMNQYVKKYPNIDTEKDVFWDFNLVYTYGLANWELSEYMVDIYIWQRSDEITGKDTCICYDDIPLTLGETEANKVKQIIVDRIADMLFPAKTGEKAVA